MANSTLLTKPPVAKLEQLISLDTLNRLPKQVAAEFQAVFFNETETELYLGIVHPELLKDRASQAIQVLEQQVGKKIKLFTIAKADFQRALAQYDKPVDGLAEIAPIVAPVETAIAPTDPNKPLSYVPGAVVSDFILRKIPLDYVRSKHILTVDYQEPNLFWVVTDRDKATQQAAVDLIARRNRLATRLVSVSKREFKRLLRARERLEVEALAEQQTEPAKQAEQLSPAEVVNEPEFAGRIVTGEVEQAGMAGLFQKASQFFSQPSEATADLQATTDIAADMPKDVTAAQSHDKNDTSVAEKPERRLSVPDSETPVVAKINIPGLKLQEDTANELDQSVTEVFKRPVTEIQQLQVIIREGSVPRIVAGIINFAIYRSASDIHVEPFGDELLIRYRVDGQLSEILKLPMEIHPALISRVKILAKLKLDESRIPQDGRFEVTASENKQIDIRVSTLPTVHGEKVVMRLLDKSGGLYNLEKLGLTGEAFNRLIESVQKPFGVILATGPTGSGKTTTLYAILQRVATTNVNVITLEDPVEYEIKGINQSYIKPKIGFTFAEGLRSVLRQDPNIIMVGEIRDAETAGMVTHAALTGHLVLSTLHTNYAAGALPRLINMQVEPFLITSAINSVVSQRLVRRITPECREKFELPTAIRKEIDAELEIIRQHNPKEASRIPDNIEFYKPKLNCAGSTTGYRGRIGLFEVMKMSDEIEDLTIKKAPAIEIEKAAIRAGMLTMKQDGILKVLAGLTTLDEVLRETTSR